MSQLNLNRKLVALIFTLVFGALVLSPTFALAADKGKSEVRGERAATIPGILKVFKTTGRASIGSGVVASKGTDSIVVTAKDGQEITVNVGEKTQFRRRFWGKSSFDEIQTGDTVNVIGRWTDDTHTAINAVLIRDLSIQKRLGVFFGAVKSMNNDVWMITTVNRGNQEVTVSSTTKFINRRDEKMTSKEVQVGHRVRVRGLWDKTKSTIREVTEVKDFDLPAKGSVEPTAVPTPTPTP